ncbi:hypothetical protein MGG_11439 [Pyricularia oryzae 70-15]|uniref:Uncharacterized protein n=3 Tax=Pyricularia oryzae TaxID=318829 RepID=G4NCG8_PYRO7|nr:uncharacterized protein MGG_11439 [Pyricularia oryzae 70-15]EHA48265.1 hypothetical protein MGG_11439 [Pyricularia oryzae 70-15]ELQ44772.1 hypothetical protein OOU_Y34scaffold00053g3 [Pyricularia oryzae Y34]
MPKVSRYAIARVAPPACKSGVLGCPYAPRGRTNNTLVMVWVGGFLTLLFMTYWISTRHADKARHYADKFAHPPMPQ